MKLLLKGNIIAIATIFVFLSLSISSCATTRHAKRADQRRGLMLMDKSEYAPNKGKWKARKKPYNMRKYKKKRGRR